MSYWLFAMVLLSDVGLNCGCGFCGGEHIAWWLMALAKCSDLRVAWLLQWLQNTPSSRGWWLYGILQPNILGIIPSIKGIRMNLVFLSLYHEDTSTNSVGQSIAFQGSSWNKSDKPRQMRNCGGHQMPWDGWLATTIKADQKLGIFGWT